MSEYVLPRHASARLTLTVLLAFTAPAALAQTIEPTKGPWTIEFGGDHPFCATGGTLPQAAQNAVDTINAMGNNLSVVECTPEGLPSFGPVVDISTFNTPACFVQPYHVDHGAFCRVELGFQSPTYVDYFFERHAHCPAGLALGRDASGNLYCAVAHDDTCPIGNPVSPTTGTKYEEVVDYRSGGREPLEFKRYYISSGYYAPGFVSGRQGGFTAHWGHNYGSRIHAAFGGSVNIVAVRPDGRLWFFDGAGNEILNHKASGGAARVDAAPSGGWTLTLASNDVENYDSNGKLVSMVTRAGMITTLAYDGSGRLSTVTDPFGKQLGFGYDAEGRLTTVSDPAGGEIAYSYAGEGSQERLASVTYADARTITYHYEDGTDRTRLTGVTDELGIRFASFTYTLSGQVAVSQHAGGAQRYEFTYSNTTISGSTQVRDPLGTQRTYSTSEIGGVYRRTAVGGGTCATCGNGASFSYDAQGNATQEIDFRGNRTCYAYDLARNLETVRVEGIPSGSSCPADLASYTPPTGTAQRKVVTSWHPTFRLPASITEDNRVTTFIYDGSGNVLTRTITDGATAQVRTWTFTYRSDGRPESENGPRTDVADVTTYTYHECASGNGCGQLHTVTNALGQTTTYSAYNAHALPTQITDANGITTTLVYDDRQRLTSRSVAGEVTTFEYWPTGLLKTVTQQDGSTLTHSYDDAHRLVGIEDGLGNRIEYVLDAMGNRTIERSYDSSNALRRAHARAYTALGLLWKEINAAGTAAVTTVFGYDNNGNQTSINAPLARNTANLYDELNRLVRVTDPASAMIHFEYDAHDNLLSVSDPRGIVTSYQYNGFGDVEELSSPDAGVTSTAYDSGGNIHTRTDARGKIGTYTHDALNRVTSISYPDNVTSFVYDSGSNGMGRLTSASDSAHSLSWQYDAQGRVTKRTQTVAGGGIAVSVDTASYVLISSVRFDRTRWDFTYTVNAVNSGTSAASGCTATVSSSSPDTVIIDGALSFPAVPAQGSATSADTFTFRQDRTLPFNPGVLSWQMQCTTAPLGNLTQSILYGYTNGNLTSLTTPSGQTITYGYSNGQIASITLNGSTTILDDVLHEPFGQVSGWTWGNGTLAARIYDLDGKISNLDSAGAYTYAYDNAFRITAITDLADAARSWTYGYSILDRLTAANRTGEIIGYTYDANGNRLTETGTQNGTYTVSPTSNRLNSIIGTPAHTYSYDAAGNVTADGLRTFTYNDAGRMITATSGEVTTSYVHNALGQRVKKSNSSLTRVFFFDESSHLLGEYDATGALVQETIWLGDVPVATLRPNGTGVAVFYVHTDHLNTPHRVSRPSDNTILWRWDSNPFGSNAANEDPDGDSASFAYDLRYPGQYHDSETQLNYNYFRDGYDSVAGRYTQSDPIGLDGGVNTYAYVDGNPLGATDPKGLVAWDGTMASVGVAAGIGAALYRFSLHTGCVNGKKGTAEVVAVGPAFGVEIKGIPPFSSTASSVTLKDKLDCVDPSV